MKTYKIGRNPDNDIIYNDPSVSGYHADIIIDYNGTITLVDHSTNGTAINGGRLHNQAREIRPTDIITFPGNNVLDWRLIQTTQPAAEPQPVATGPTPSAFDDLTCRYQSPRQMGNNIPPQAPMSEAGDKQVAVIDFSYSAILREGFGSGFRNALSLFAIWILTILTIWIPYLNVGALIANASLAPLWSSGKSVNPFQIFDSKYRKHMGEFYLTILCMAIGYIFFSALMIFPALVLIYSWMFAPFMVVYKDMPFGKALRISNECTYGYKWSMFFVGLLAGLIILVMMLCVGGINYLIYTSMGMDDILSIIISSVISLICFTLTQSIMIGIKGAMWNRLSQRI